MWDTDLWRSWSLSVESASNGNWIPGEDIGTLKQMIDGNVAGYAHVTYDGEHVITPWATPSGNDARTVLRGGDVLGSAARWVKGAGAVKMRSAHAARAKQTTTVINKAFLADRAQSLVAHLQGVGIVAVCWENAITEARAEVRTNLPSGGALTIVLYASGDVYVRDAAGSARALEILAAAVDDWENRPHD